MIKVMEYISKTDILLNLPKLGHYFAILHSFWQFRESCLILCHAKKKFDIIRKILLRYCLTRFFNSHFCQSIPPGHFCLNHRQRSQGLS